MSGSGEPISGNIQFSDMDAPSPEDFGVGNHSPSEMPDLAGVFDRKSGTPLFGSGEPISGIFSSRTWMPRGRTIPELETIRPQRCRTSQAFLIGSPERPCLGPVNRSPGIFSSLPPVTENMILKCSTCPIRCE